MKLKRIVLMPGITTPASISRSAGAKKITKAIGRAFLPFARPAIVKINPRTIKKIAIAENAEVNLGIFVERNSDIS
jgi:hypothetical protein